MTSVVHWEYSSFPFPRLVCTNCDVGYIDLDQSADRCPVCGAWIGYPYTNYNDSKPFSAYSAMMKGWRK